MMKSQKYSPPSPLLSFHLQSQRQNSYNHGYDLSIYSFYRGVNAQSSPPACSGLKCNTAWTVYLPCSLSFQNKAPCVFSRPPAVSHDLPGREQQPTGESVDTARDQKHNTLGLLWAKPLEASWKVNISLKRKIILEYLRWDG